MIDLLSLALLCVFWGLCRKGFTGFTGFMSAWRRETNQKKRGL